MLPYEIMLLMLPYEIMLSFFERVLIIDDHGNQIFKSNISQKNL